MEIFGVSSLFILLNGSWLFVAVMFCGLKWNEIELKASQYFKSLPSQQLAEEPLKVESGCANVTSFYGACGMEDLNLAHLDI